jgi:hypothetical protein
MKKYQVEFRYYTNSQKFSMMAFDSLEEMHQHLLYMPQELKVDAEIFVHINGERFLMEDYLFNTFKNAE